MNVLLLTCLLWTGGMSPTYSAEVTTAPVAAVCQAYGDDALRFVRKRYPDATILDRDRDDGLIEVKIKHRGIEKIVVFSPDEQWLRTTWEIRRERLPRKVVSALQRLGFSFSDIDDNDNKAIETRKGMRYAVQAERGDYDGVFIVTEGGSISDRYHTDEWDDGDDCIHILDRGDDRWDDGEDRFDEGDDEWDDRHQRNRRIDRRDDGEDHFDEGDDEWDDRNKRNRRATRRDNGEDRFDEGDDEWDD